ncbi:NAD(P)H-dependent oxidoreductase [Proteiniphilum sp. UBA1028]|jgi:nitroreductase/dihydropteridine reductase|uniref:NAD(P)H-dependent oxidoreductase n=1 Tax=Proteiniphilum sp. UBA1028 TaxID=1947251 RepID=UPI000E7D62E2|nr:NAD(P)H-dependent oxidoreductase [Proteiniphilum sp. UBA1028]HBG56955.1 NAD(P)H-dependent oxidoreductase [Porphyromonadaceae bacterium]
MSFLDIAKSRYTTKKYDSSLKIDNATIEKLKEILRLSPSSINSQPWKFTFIFDTETKKELAKVSYNNGSKVNDASHVVVFSVVEDVKDFEEKNLSLLPEKAGLYYNRVLKSRNEAEIKTWLACQVYLSLGFFLSACASMEIDSTPMEGIQSEEYDRILQQDGYKTLFAVAIGYRDKEDANQPSLTPKLRLDPENVIRSI